MAFLRRNVWPITGRFKVIRPRVDRPDDERGDGSFSLTLAGDCGVGHEVMGIVCAVHSTR